MNARPSVPFQTHYFGRRQREPRGSRVPVVLLTGFLGAGKTTLLNQFLASPEGANTLVIVNEFGSVAIDNHLLRTGADHTILLENGCLCCIVRSELETALRQLAVQRSRGDIGRFDRIVIETTGLADPGPVLGTFVADPALNETYHVEAVITVVDAVHGLASLADSPEAALQVGMADRLVISKADLAGSHEAARVGAELRERNAGAELIVAPHPQGVGHIFATHESTHAFAAGFTRAFQATAHGREVQTCALRFVRPFSWPVLRHILETVTFIAGDKTLRIKGLASLEECSGPVAIHAVRQMLHPPVELQAWPDADTASRFVFITRGLEPAAIAALFEAVLALGRTTAPRSTQAPAP